MNTVVKKRASALFLSVLLSAAACFPAAAQWENEHLGPGEAVWTGAPSEHPMGSMESDTIILPAAPGDAPDANGPGSAPQTPDISPEASGEGPHGNGEEIAPDGTRTGTPSAEAPATGNASHTAETPEAQPEGSAAPGEAELSTPADNPYLIMSNGRELDLRKPMVALTYDDGPYAPVGNKIMDIAAQYDARVTFFMVGDRVKSYQTEVRRMAAEGHELANHTYNHKYLNKLGAAEIRAQVEKCSNVIEEVSGIRPAVMRLPGGNKNSTVLQNVNMPIILWNVDTLDWSTRNTQKTIDAALSGVKDGNIILMHELYRSTADAAAVIIPKLHEMGFQMVTVSELAKFKGKELSPNQIYYSIR